MGAVRVQTRWLRRSLERQVAEALDRLTEPTPYQTWPGGIVVGGRAFTTRELADRLLDGGAAGAEGRARTILAPTAVVARNLWVALGVCPACPDHRDVAVVASILTPGGRFNVSLCDPCGDTRRPQGYDVVPILAGVS